MSIRPYHRHALLVIIVAACMGSAGCSSEPDAASPRTPEEAEALLEGRLEADTGVRWKVHVDRSSREVRFAAPLSPVELAGGSVEERVRGFFTTYAEELHPTSAEELRLVDQGTDDEGRSHVRFEHVLTGSGLTVFGAFSVAAVGADGRLLYAEPGFRRDVAKVERVASVDRAAAERTAIQHVRAECDITANDMLEVKATELGVSAEIDRPAALAWQIDLRSGAGTCAAPRVVVDAISGAVLARHERAAFLLDRAGGVRFHALGETSDTKAIDVTPVPDLFGPQWIMLSESKSPKVHTMSYGRVLDSELATRRLGEWDTGSRHRGAAVDAHYHATKALLYFKEVHGRNGLDGKGTDLKVVVHDPEEESKGANAHYFDYGIFFDDDQLHIGDGNDGDFLPLSAGFDILTHELAHGVTNRTSRLEYEHESGALNEAFSDVMAASAENWLPETRDARNNVFIGERATRSGRGLRRMDDPSADGRAERDHYRERRGCKAGERPDFRANDYCGVHFNSGIGNRAFTLMTLGGTHKTSKVTVARGLGWERARRLWFNSFSKLTSKATFYQAALVQLTHAAAEGLDVLSNVACAWFAVGVLDPTDMRIRNVACGAPPPSSGGGGAKRSSCEGVADGLVCNSQAPYSAMICKSGMFSGSVLCQDLSKRCRAKSADDFTASLAQNGTLVCE